MTEPQENSYYGHMDYLTKSFSWARHPGEILPTGHKPFYVEGEAIPFSHYNRAWRLRCGGTFHMSNDKAQGARLDLTGDNLAYIREYTGWTCDHLMKLLAANPLHKRTTRVDYCFNAVGDGNIAELWHWCEGGNYKGRLKLDKSHKTPASDVGITVPFGSKHSEFFVRAYDKGAEMKNLSMAWARVEAQFRGEYAQNAAHDSIVGDGLAAHTRTKIKQSIGEIPFGWWEKALEGETTDIKKLVRKDTKWLNRMNQLMQEIMKKCIENEEILDYVEEQWLPTLAENVMRARAVRNTPKLGEMNTVEPYAEVWTINDDWTITRKM